MRDVHKNDVLKSNPYFVKMILTVIFVVEPLVLED